MATDARRKILTLFGTRPEIIKLAPVLRELEAHADRFVTCNVSSAQHVEILDPFVRLFGVRVDHDLHAMRPGQSVNLLFSRVLAAFDEALESQRPDLVLVQGDTTTALAGALAAFQRRIPVGHVEAGLRSGHATSPFPEEMNRRLISRVARLHFAATARNRVTLLSEGVPAEHVFVTGNPVVDALQWMLRSAPPSREITERLEATRALRRLVLTTHRRESFGDRLAANLRVLRNFIERHPDAALLFPVHPNPAVAEPAQAILSGHARIHLLPPLDYADFIHLLANAWLIVSDSGGVQEEAPTLGKAMLVLRENTERPEAIAAGVARLVGPSAQDLERMLDECWSGGWIDAVRSVPNPFGQGDSAQRIVQAILSAIA